MNIGGNWKRSDVVIYGLCCPNTGLLKYVGQTRQPLMSRLLAHIRERRPCRKTTWLQSLGRPPEIIEIESCHQSDANQVERFYISLFKSCGALLLNETAGGFGAQHSAEAIAKISLAKTGIVPSPETRAKLSLAGMGRKLTEEEKKKISLSKLGKKRSPETCWKMSVNRKNRKPVVCVDTGVRFDCTNDAGKWIGTSAAANAIRNAIKLGSKSFGLRWEFA